MQNRNVLITTHHDAFLYPRGGEIEMKIIHDLLNKYDINTKFYSHIELSEKKFDVIIHFSVHNNGYELLRKLKNLNKRIILYPNLWWNDSINENEINNAKKFFDLSNLIIFKSSAEFNNVSKKINLKNYITKIIYPFVKDDFEKKVDHKKFKFIYDLDQFILSIGVIEKNKNQLNLIKSFKKLNRPNLKLVIIGEHIDKDYFEECKLSANENVIFLPQMNHASDIQIAAIQSCDLYVELSNEPAGLSALEVAKCEKKILIKKSQWGDEFFGNEKFSLENLNEYIISKKINLLIKEPNLIKKKIFNEIKKKTDEKNIYQLIEVINN